MSGAATALAGLGLTLTLWNVTLAGAIARTPARERLFRFVTALAALLLIPGLLVAAATGSVLTNRVTASIWWFWPVTVTLFAVQATWAVAARLARPLIGLPIALWNVALAGAIWASAFAQHGVTAAWFGEWAEGAMRLALAPAAGPVALVSPFAIWLPVIGPAYPPRWKASVGARWVVALLATLALALTGWSVPRARALQQSFDRFGDERLTERPLGDFSIGLIVLPSLDHPAAPLSIRSDFALADSIEADVLLIEIAPSVRAGALDSLARALEGPRRDSAQLAIAPTLAADAPLGRERDRMLVAIERAVRRLQPDIVFTEPTANAGAADDPARRRWFELVRTATRRGGSRARVAPLARARRADSAWFRWADSAAGTVGIVVDGTAGGVMLAEELRVATSWAATPGRSDDSTRVAWLLGPRAAPAVTGQGAQARALWGTLAWATRTPGIAGMIVGPAADYERITGLRDALGRLRAAGRTYIRASRALHATLR